MTPLEEQFHRAQMRDYWERNAPLTCVVLTLAVLISGFAHPLDWRQVLGCSIAGVTFYLGLILGERGFQATGTLLALITIPFGAWTALEFGLRSGPLMWVQAGGTFAAAICASLVFHRAARDDTTDVEH